VPAADRALASPMRVHVPRASVLDSGDGLQDVRVHGRNDPRRIRSSGSPPNERCFPPNFHERQISSAADSPRGAPELISPCGSLRGFGCVTSETATVTTASAAKAMPAPQKLSDDRSGRPRFESTQGGAAPRGARARQRAEEERSVAAARAGAASIAPSMSATTNGSTLPADRQRSRSELASAASARPIGPPARRPEPEGQCQRREARGPHHHRARRTLAPRDDRTPSRPRPLVEAVSVDGTGASVRRQRAAVTSRCRSR
jgi:hypothetical protein